MPSRFVESDVPTTGDIGSSFMEAIMTTVHALGDTAFRLYNTTDPGLIWVSATNTTFVTTVLPSVLKDAGEALSNTTNVALRTVPRVSVWLFAMSIVCVFLRIVAVAMGAKRRVSGHPKLD